MDKDLKFKIITEGSSIGVSKVCEKYNISRTLYYRWLNRYKSKGLEGLNPIKKKFVPTNKTNEAIEKTLLNLIKKYPSYGPKAIKYLLHDMGYKVSESAIYNIMKRHNLSNKEARIIFSRKHSCKSIEIPKTLPKVNDMNSGECWLFWVTDYGVYNNLGHIYEYTFFDFKSKIACSRLYNEANFNNFEELLTATAMPVAKTLNLRLLHLCFLQDNKTFNLSKKNFNAKMDKLIEDNRFDFKAHVISDKLEELNEVSILKEEFTSSISNFLIPMINSGMSFSKLKLEFQKYLRDYNITYKSIYINEKYTPVEYHNKTTNTKPILPMWAYINREY